MQTRPPEDQQGRHGQRRGPNDAMGSYPTEGANAQTRSEQNRMDCRMTLSSVNDEVTQWFFDDYMSTWIGVVSGVIARETDFILDYWSVPLHYTAGSQLGNTTVEVGSGPDTLSEYRIGLQSSLQCSHSETYVA